VIFRGIDILRTHFHLHNAKWWGYYKEWSRRNVEGSGLAYLMTVFIICMNRLRNTAIYFSQVSLSVSGQSPAMKSRSWSRNVNHYTMRYSTAHRRPIWPVWKLRCISCTQGVTTLSVAIWITMNVSLLFLKLLRAFWRADKVRNSLVSIV
jgi:hypothetical protein